MKPPIRALVVAQALVVGALVAYAIWRALPPDDPFSRLMQVVRADGAVAAAKVLGPDILKAAEACPPDQLPLLLAKADRLGCRTIRADAHAIAVQCGPRRFTIERWADGFRAEPRCPPLLPDL